MQHPQVLLVDDEPNTLTSLRSALRREPMDFHTAGSAEEALGLLAAQTFDAVVSDECMPGMHGAELLEEVLRRSPDTVRILLTGHASLDAAARAVNRAHVDRFLLKPCPADEIALVLREALEKRRRARTDSGWRALQDAQERAETTARFDLALATLRPVFQPIFDRVRRDAAAVEVLMRCDEECFASPLELLEAARALERGHELHRKLRELVSREIDRWPADTLFFLNVEPEELLDDAFYAEDDPMRRHAARVVLEVTERGSLSTIPLLAERLERLRAKGYRFAIDDVGAGYAGLNSLALIDPEFVKLDREIVHGIATSATKQRIVEALVDLCRRSGAQLVAEGVETTDELDVVETLECDLLQGMRLQPPLEADEARAARTPRP